MPFCWFAKKKKKEKRKIFSIPKLTVSESTQKPEKNSIIGTSSIINLTQIEWWIIEIIIKLINAFRLTTNPVFADFSWHQEEEFLQIYT